MHTLLDRCLAAVGVFSLMSAGVLAQSPPAPASHVSRTIKVVAYRVGDDTTIDLKSSGLSAGAGGEAASGEAESGEAKVDPKPSLTTIEAKVKGLKPATQFGAEFLAYVMWAVSPEGRAVNLGELRPNDDGEGTLKASTQLQSFSLFVTAEPYPAVRQPSEIMVLENEARKNTAGRLFAVTDYALMKRSEYEKLGNPLALSLDLKNVPLEMYHARNAVEIAKARGADRYASEAFSRAQRALGQAETALTRKADKKQIISLARETQQSSEDARAITVERVEAERVASERAAAAAKATAQAEAKAAAEAAAAKQRADEAARMQAELAAAREAQLKAEAAAKQAEALRQEDQLRAAAAAQAAEAARQEEQLRAAAATQAAEAAAREASAKAEADRAQAEAERARSAAAELRAQLLDQFNRVLETRDTPRGLVITMADVLFDTGKYEVRPATREALARLSGIVLAHPGLHLEVEGHTDSTGSDELNQTLSEQRAGAVRSYLVQQGLSADAITAQGLGKTTPVADNETAAGRQKNRRVELIVSGEVIGVKIGN